MKTPLLICLLIIITCFGCSETKTPETQLQASPDSTQFFTTSSFYQEQLNQVKLLKKPIRFYTTFNGVKDSGDLNLADFEKYVAGFMAMDISNATDKKNYRETVFQDAGTNSYTLSYTAINKTVPVQGTDILLDEQSNQVKRIFIRSFLRKGDTTIQERHNWHAFKSFQIIRTITFGKTVQEQLTNVLWGNVSADE